MTENEKLFQTAMKAYLLSSEVSLNDLRAYGRVIGIESPTKKTKPVLIDEIIALFLGELAPVPVSSKGAPVKNKYIQPIVLNTINKICEEYKVFEKYENVVTEEKPISEVEAYNRAFFQNRPQAVKLVLESTTPTLYDEVASHVTYKGQLHKIKEVFYLLPLNCNDGEKILISEVGQVTPCHFHWNKMEDIINRGGGELVIEVYNSTKDEQLDNTDVDIYRDGRHYTVPAGSKVRLAPGESISIQQGMYHKFWAEGEKVLIGEVSMVNDDNADNRFYLPAGRFPEIDEDEAPVHYLANEYPYVK